MKSKKALAIPMNIYLYIFLAILIIWIVISFLGLLGKIPFLSALSPISELSSGIYYFLVIALFFAFQGFFIYIMYKFGNVVLKEFKDMRNKVFKYSDYLRNMIISNT